jgi:RNA polymerase sigma-70 factor (ECF subfamily)
MFFPASRIPNGFPHERAAVDLLDLQSHRDRLLHSALSMCGNKSEAEDLVQETFLKALKLARRFRGDSSVHTWLHGILLNVRHHAIREQKKQKFLILDEELAQRATVEPDSADAADQQFCAARLAEALTHLSPEHREAIVSRYYSDLTIHEIAARTAACEGTVKSRLHYALRSLARFLPKELNPFLSTGTHHR